MHSVAARSLPVDHVVDRAVPASDDEQPLLPLLGGPYRIIGTLGLNPLDLEALELGADLIGIVLTPARGGVADHPCFGLLHSRPLLQLRPR